MQLSPLRYPGGKSRAVKILNEFIPTTSKIISPFFGGGSFENFLSKSGKQVIGYDYCQPLADFWFVYKNYHAELFKRMHQLGEHILQPQFHGVDPKSPERLEQKDIYWKWKDIALNSPDQFERGLHYFALNRTAFSGLTLIAGPMSTQWMQQKIGPKALANLEKIEWCVDSVSFASCFETIPTHTNDVLYLDPPYVMETPDKEAIYGENGDLHKFDHTLLRDQLRSHKDKWVLSYLNVPTIHELYKDFNIKEVNWTYTMKPGQSRPQGKEVVITNF